ncbi:hypothetical protein N8J89_07860 [Crossiella sp. CA-258035]|uniref:hypothetical protein n=1 Tax=Crossiella sp. CA-258035 TaxID=2981138 RepID=UPI0024BC0211|nr:hypothetical protein [Crossiella sp. CA-258035]WHT20969.1 hypothetical protein N8J89_07860 [Crossiella sp. CA-258035]
MAEIGHVVINCPRCGQPRHIAVTAETRPFEERQAGKRRTYAFNAVLRGERVGQIHILIDTLLDNHRCGSTKPAFGLSLAPDVAEETDHG